MWCAAGLLLEMHWVTLQSGPHNQFASTQVHIIISLMVQGGWAMRLDRDGCEDIPARPMNQGRPCALHAFAPTSSYPATVWRRKQVRGISRHPVTSIAGSLT